MGHGAFEIVHAHAETLDVDRAAGLRVGFDDDGVQTRIAGCRLELRG